MKNDYKVERKEIEYHMLETIADLSKSTEESHLTIEKRKRDMDFYGIKFNILYKNGILSLLLSDIYELYKDYCSENDLEPQQYNYYKRHLRKIVCQDFDTFKFDVKSSYNGGVFNIKIADLLNIKNIITKEK